MAVKNTKKTVAAEVKKAETVAEVKVEPVKTIETVTAEVKAPVKEEVKPVEKKATTTKKVAEKKTTEKKVAEKKTTTKKKEVVSVCVQFAGNEYDVFEVVEKAKAAYEGKTIKEINVYVKPEEGMAYYVVNGEETGSVAL